MNLIKFELLTKEKNEKKKKDKKKIIKNIY